ncbi:Copper-transporting ATPase, putative [Penicillium digitatum]|uniref:P-type Cu(+) transporter n=3 Tax=Penicillium digitatum TaxID=36651 RepID=K9FE40_PEND2|nr:Copper-transporting ATPase, putative [Penicillium digitatum Pd1]EKV07434.1 Copper-transporting ATPase, putative [Penicillium digitatum PHI26]EKV14470.1 Copper-transporting ATPase, putative [Penicillium digitatum Pd1]QQK46006.1 Copper-transporting ATPase, putative [Penicillium digitatum]
MSSMNLQSGGVSRPAMATTTIKVDGMTCGACTSAVEGAFQGVDGAHDVSVSLIMGRAAVQHDPWVLPPAKIAEMIEDCGFDAAVLSTEEQRNPDPSSFPATRLSVTNLAIEGMTCGACTSAVESGLNDVSGVNSVDVSLLSERAVVEHDAEIITPEQIAELIEDRGFGARVLDTSLVGSKEPSAPAGSEEKSRLLVTTIAIGGMTCGACTSSVQGALGNVDGVIQLNISLLAERAVVVHDPSILPASKIADLVEDAGFDASIVSSEAQASFSKNTQQVNLSLHGLRDGVSATELEENIFQQPGVHSASIKMATSRMVISFDPCTIGIRSIVEAIEAAGYNALIVDSDDTNAQLQSLSKTKEIQDWKRSFIIAASFAVPVFLISMILPMYLPSIDFGSFALFPGLYLGDLVCLALTIPVQFGIGKRFYVTSFKSLKHRSPTMDVLVMLGTSAAFFYSCFTMIMALCGMNHRRPSTVFDTSTMLITFITLGRWLENRAKGQTSAALSRLMCLTPSMTTIYEDPIAAEKLAERWTSKPTPGAIEQPTLANDMTVNQRCIPTELIQVGDVVILHPGDKVSADGVVIRGESYVDESMISGEALPIHKKKGSQIIAGTVNGTNSIDFKVIRTGKDTQLSQIVKLVQDAQTSRAPIQRMADIVAGYFVPTIIGLGLITFFGWMFLSHVLPHPPTIFEMAGSGGRVMVCLKLCISVIVFACPCALGLSTPTAVMVGTGVGAEHGILVKGGAVLEAATKITHVVFDKTGTLTTGRMSVNHTRIEPQWTVNDWRRQLWWLIVGLAETGSEHPIGRAIFSAAITESGHPGEDGLPGSTGDVENSVGRGVSAIVEPASSGQRIRHHVFLGNAKFLRSKDVPVPADADPDSADSIEDLETDVPKPGTTAAGVTRIHVAIDNRYAGTISLRDTVKATAVAAVAALHRMGISTSMVTGDTLSTAISIATAVGIPTASISASVSPSEKRSIVSALQEKGERVAMVGDGINDSPALATASVGIALASGTDVAVEAADIVLMRPDDLLSVPASLSLSRSVFRRIKLNLVWACMYNVIGLPFAMGLFLPFTGFMLPPMAAGGAMALSSVSVVVSSLLLKFWSRPSWMEVERLEKELRSGAISPAGVAHRGHARKVSWWASATILSDSPRSLRHRVRDVVSSLWSLVTGKGPIPASRGDEGYVPLQTVEPPV